MFQILKPFFCEIQEAEEMSKPTIACVFASCLRSISINRAKPQLSLGRPISQTLAAIGYTSSVRGIFLILKWPEESSRKLGTKIIENLHQPDMCSGLHIFQEL